MADNSNHRLQICDDVGTCTAVGSQGAALGQFSFPLGVAVDNHDRFVVADTLNQRIQVCDEQLSCTEFGSQGTGLGQFQFPQGVAASPNTRTDTNAANNSDSVSVAVDAPVVEADLSIVSMTSVASVMPGDVFDYTLVVSNSGQALQNLSVFVKILVCNVGNNCSCYFVHSLVKFRLAFISFF